jgi:hypothetical protein
MPINDSEIQIQARGILDGIAFPPFEQCHPALLSELEAIILRATEPPYNVQIPMEM